MRKLMWFTAGFAMACALGVSFCVESLLGPAVFAGILAVVLLVGRRWERNFRLPGTVLLGVSVGLVFVTAYCQVPISDAAELDGKTENATFYVRDYSYDTQYGTAVEATVVVNDRAYRAKVYLDRDYELEPGHRILGTFEFKYTLEEDGDGPSYNAGQGRLLLAYQRGNAAVERCWKTGIWDKAALWRQQLREILDDAFPEDTAGFAKALLLGDRTGIDYETDTNFKVSGISHIIAVSGMHLTILFSFLYLLTGRRRLLLALLGIPAVLAFAALTGFTPSVNRAAIMQLVMILAMVSKREYDGPTALSFAALLLLIINPFVITTVSFQLSFACMAGILAFAEPLRGWFLAQERLGKWDSSPIRFLASSLSVTLAANVFTLPLCAIHFGMVSLIGPLTNLLTLWVITYIFYAVIGVCLVSFLSASAAGALASVTAWPIRYVLECSGWLANFPLAAVYLDSKYIVVWLVFFCVLLGIFLMIKRKPVPLFASLAAVTLCIAIGLSWAEPLLDDTRVTVLDVGQGQCILLRSNGRNFMIDCGGDYPEDAADKAAQTLLSQGISRLDGIIVTHFDSDHAGGIPHLLTRISADAVFLPFIYDQSGLGAGIRALAGDRATDIWQDTFIECGNASITLFAPESYNSGNESSMCVLFDSEKCDILVTGDRGTVGERLFANRVELPKVDILIAGHHGAQESTTPLLLEAVEPKYVFISVGADNRYGHPHDALLWRLAEAGCIVYCTDECGDIIYRG